MKLYANGIGMILLSCLVACAPTDRYDARVDAGDVVDCVRSSQCQAPLQCIHFICQSPSDAGPEDTVVDANSGDRETLVDVARADTMVDMHVAEDGVSAQDAPFVAEDIAMSTDAIDEDN